MVKAARRNVRKRPFKTAADIEREVVRLSWPPFEFGPDAIANALATDPVFADRQLPTVRTIVNIRKRHRPADPADPWTSLGADPGDAELVLPVLRALIRRSTLLGQRPWLDRAQAEAIVAIRRAAPDLDPWSVYNLTVFILSGVVDAADVDAYLAFGSWRDETAAEQYGNAYRDGVIGQALNLNYEDPDEVYLAEMNRRAQEARDDEQR